jgi:hypothetical protein
MILEYSEARVQLYLVPENEEEVELLTNLWHERVVLVQDTKVTFGGDLTKLSFKVYKRK